MLDERRDFLRAAGAAGAIAIFTPKTIRAVEKAAQRLSAATPEEAAKDEDLREIAHPEGTAILLSTHDLDLALRSADRIWLLPKGGALQVGAPEELVLSGAFGEAFASEGVAFDERRGSFRINEDHNAGEVGVTGDEIGALWTARALERCGFSAAENGDAAALSVEVLRQDKQVTWFLNASGQMQSYSSLIDLLRRLETYK